MDREWRNGQKRSDKLRRSLASHIPKSWPPEMTSLFLNRLSDAVSTAFNEASPPTKVIGASLLSHTRRRGLQTSRQSERQKMGERALPLI